MEAAAVTTRRRRSICALHTGITRSMEHRLHKDLFLGQRSLISHKQLAVINISRSLWAPGIVSFRSFI